MFLIRLIRQAAIVYAILQLVNFILPFVVSGRPKWMEVLERICAPGINLGKKLAEKLFPDKTFKIDVAPLMAILVCWVIQWVLGWFV